MTYAAPDPEPVTVRRVATPDLTAEDLAQVLDLVLLCWPDGDFTTEDIAHAMGGFHWLAEAGGRIVAHVAVVPRELEADGVPIATGYAEAMATHPDWRHRGLATRLMTLLSDHIRDTFELGALSTGLHVVYKRVGWERWRGPAFARTPHGVVRTEEEDDGIMILRTSRTPPLTGTEALSCEWRTGDVW